MKKDFKIQRCITFYEKNGDNFVGERCLTKEEFSFDELTKVFKKSKEDPYLYKQYDIDMSLSKKMKERIDYDFDFNKYDYFLETFNVSIDSKIDDGVRYKDE